MYIYVQQRVDLNDFHVDEISQLFCICGTEKVWQVFTFSLFLFQFQTSKSCFAALILAIIPPQPPQMRSWCWPEPNWTLQAAAIVYSTLFTNRLREVHHKRKSEQRQKWTISSPNAGKAMQWLCDCGWTIRRMTSTKGETAFESVHV